MNFFKTFLFCGILISLNEANAMVTDPLEARPSQVTVKQNTLTSHFLEERSATTLLEQLEAIQVVLGTPAITQQERDDLELDRSLLLAALDHQETVERDVAQENMFSVNQLATYAEEDGEYTNFYKKVLLAQRLGIEKFSDEPHLDALIATKNSSNNK